MVTRKDCGCSSLYISDFSSSDLYCLFQNAVSTVSSDPFIILWGGTSVLSHFRILEFANVAAFDITKDPSHSPGEGNYLLCLGDTKRAHAEKCLHTLFMQG